MPRAAHADDADYLLSDLVAAERWHFWFRSRRDIVEWLINTSATERRDILEVGCGTGQLLRDLMALSPTARLAGCDILLEALDYARCGVPVAALFQADAHRLPVRRQFDVVIALDVIEHLDDDSGALEEMFRVVKPGGALVLTVPQHQWLWSQTDEFSRHRRRYSRAELLTKTRAVGFEILRCTSFFTATLPLIALHRFLPRRPATPVAELRISRPINAIASALLRPEAWLIKHGVSMPIGSSLIVAARRPLSQ